MVQDMEERDMVVQDMVVVGVMRVTLGAGMALDTAGRGVHRGMVVGLGRVAGKSIVGGCISNVGMEETMMETMENMMMRRRC